MIVSLNSGGYGEFGEKERLGNDRFCIERDVQPEFGQICHRHQQLVTIHGLLELQPRAAI